MGIHYSPDMDGGINTWTSGDTYRVDDVVWLAADDKIYACTIENSDVTFTPANWQELSASTGVDEVDGGFANSVYLVPQSVDGGGA